MTKYEKLSTVFSLIAIVLAIALPLLSYYWLDPEIRNFQRRAKLQVTGSLIDSETKEPLVEQLTMRNLPRYLAAKYELSVTNTGQLPGKDIRIVTYLTPCPYWEKQLQEVTANDFVFEPPVPFQIETVNTQTFLILNRAIAPKDTVKISFTKVPERIVISNEFGETNVISTGTLKEMCRSNADRLMKITVDGKPVDRRRERGRTR